MRIQHNIMAMNAYRNYSSNTSALSKNLEKLSSGYKINRAGDDAAGLAISEKMRAQITGLETAQKNAKDGISLIQTAEGALTEVHDMLNRMVELADQSANGTYDNEVDRANLQKEFDALRSEIDRISQASNFNGINLLNGDQKQKLVESALGAQLDGIDGMSPDAATAANITVKLDKAPAPAGTEPSKTTDGQKPSEAVKASATIELNGIAQVGEVKGARADGVFTTDVFTGTGDATGVDQTLTIEYLDANGEKKTVDVTKSGSTDTAVADVVTALAGEINKNADLKLLFTAKKDDASVALQFTAKADAGKAAILGVTVKETGTGGGGGTLIALANPAPDATKSAPTGVDLSAANATVEIGGTTYTKVANKGAVKSDTEFYDINSLNALLEKKGITATDKSSDLSKSSMSHVTFEPKKYEVTIGGNGAGKIETGKTTINQLGAITMDGSSASAKLSELYDVKINGEVVKDWTSTDVIKGGDTIELVAKTTGAQLADVAKDLAGIKGDAQITTTVGLSEGSGGAAAKTQYELTFDFTKLAGGQTFQIGDKTFEFVTDDASKTTGTQIGSGNTNIAINISGKTTNMTDPAGQEAIRDEIQTAFDASGSLNDGSANSVFTIDKGAVSNNSVTIKLTGTAAVSAAELKKTNLGQVKVSESAKATGAITSTYVAGHEEHSGDKGTFATAEYDFDISTLKENDVITIGDTSITVVADPPAGAKVGPNEISLSDLATNGDKNLMAAFETAGYDMGRITIDTVNKKLTIKDNVTGGSGDALAAGAGKFALSTVADGEITATSADGTLDITTGTTTYKDILNKEIDGNKVSDLFTVKVNGKEVTLDNGSTTFKAGDEITFEAKMKGEQTAKIMDAFNFKSGANVDKVNGTAEGQAGSASKTQYELNFDITKMADGQHFSIGNKEGKSVTFELSTDGTANKEGAVAINIGGMDPTTVDGQKKILEAIKTAVSDTAKGMGTDFDVKTGDLDGGKFSMNLTAKKEGPDYNLGAVRVSEAPTGAISGTYSAASSAAGAKEGSFAEVSYALDLSKLQNGDVLEIGGTKIEITDGSSAGNKLNINDAKDAEKLISAFEQNGFDTGRLAIADDKLTVTGKKVGQTAADLAAGMGKVSLTSTTRDMSAKEGGLVLQIGDTSDSFNQLTVSIDKMDCEALGIDAAKINIDSQNGAADSVSVLKNAINMVSSTRGDLGALQNRLEHTINNLSVMTENIQDAESTIRDVDVAQEMMEYTKNNILVQSAQAMLAQANQVPQGVLQLLG